MGLMVFVASELCARVYLHVTFPGILAETVHCQHDPLLGWRHIPGIRVTDMYGPGKNLTINNQGFRASRDFPKQVQDGKNRVICLGDSFTLGYGVDDGQTFCSSLEAQDSSLEVINMGQGGYGLDQMFLWYEQERERFEHQTLLVCFIDADLNRMNTDLFDTYTKPWLRLDGKAIQVMNAPVPDKNVEANSPVLSWIKNLGLVRVAKQLQSIIFQQPQGVYHTQEELLDTAMALFWEMRNYCQSKGVKMGIVRLPTADTLEADTPFFQRLNQNLEVDGFQYINLVEDFRKLSAPAAANMFIDETNTPKQLLQYQGMGAHYSPYGNSVIGSWLFRELLPQG